MENSIARKRLATATLMAGLCITAGIAVSHAANQSDVITSDPCVLVTAADLRAVLGVTFPAPEVGNDIESRQCQYKNDNLLVSVFTGNEELSDFQKDQAMKRNDTMGKTIKVSNVSVPFYLSIGEGRLIVWKNKTRLTVGVVDFTSKMSDASLEAAREKLINIALSRIN